MNCTGLIRARLRSWLLKQRADAGYTTVDDPVMRTHNWDISSGVLLGGCLWRFDVSYVEHEWAPGYHATVHIDAIENKVVSIEWANPENIPEAVKKPVPPPPDYGAWS